MNPTITFCFAPFLHIGGIYRELLPKAEYFSQALYTFDIGQNDITTGFFINMTSEQVIAYIPDLMERLTNIIQVQRLYNTPTIFFKTQKNTKLFFSANNSSSVAHTCRVLYCRKKKKQGYRSILIF